MNTKGVALIGLAVLFAVLITACGSVATSPQLATPAPKSEAASPVTKTWQQQWDKLIAEAKKEGQVVIASSAGTDVRDAFTRSFSGKYGVTLQFMSGKPAELVPKVQAERKAGLYLVDLFMGGIGTIVPLLGPEGALEKMDNALLLPEVLDPKAWWGDNLLFTSPEHYQVMFLAFPQPPIAFNTDLVRTDEIKSYHDLLNPRWKGQISLLDPAMAGGGNNFFKLTADLFGLDYLRELGKLEPVITRDGRLLAEWVARGKYAIAIGIKPEETSYFRKAGAPIKTVTPAEGNIVTGGGGGLVFMNRAPHPNAAKLYVNWLLSKEGGMVASEAYGAQSGRKDVPTDFLDPDFVRQPGLKYYPGMDEAAEVRKREYMKLAKEMYGHLLK